MPINQRFGRRARWTRRAPGLYRRDTEHAQGFVWASPRPVGLWAWAVYSEGRCASGVEFKFRTAKCKAVEAIQEAHVAEWWREKKEESR